MAPRRRSHLPVPDEAFLDDPELVLIRPIPTADAVGCGENFDVRVGDKVGHKVGLIIRSYLQSDGRRRSLTLNFEPWLNFGRLRPLHTSGVVFAFGGNILIASSFYVVQRTCRTRLWGGNLAWFVFWGYQLFIILAATGYLLGATQSADRPTF